MDDWYQITVSHIHENGGQGLLNMFHGSLYRALLSVYPHHSWMAWRFQQSVPHGYWDNMENQRKFMDWLGRELGYKKQEDWYRITWMEISNHGGSGLLSHRYGNSPYNMLKTIYFDF